MNKEKKSSFPAVLSAIIILLALGAGGFLLLKDTNPPVISISPDTANVGKGTEIHIAVKDMGSGLKSVTVVASQGDKTIPLIQKDYPGGVSEVDEVVVLAKGEVSEGEFTLHVSAQDASLYPFGEAGLSSATMMYEYDATPPRIYVQSHTNNLNQGGSALMVYSLSEVAETTGIQLGERFFPAYLQSSTNGNNLYYCMFAMPWDTPPAEFKPVIIANDKAGNSAQRSFNHHTNARNFRRDKIRLSDSFIERTLPEFHSLIPQEGAPIDKYIYINNTLRKQNRAKLIELSRHTAPTMLWSGPFQRLPNAANRARYADSRDYMYKGKKVDFQTHLGLDLASIKHAPVPAGNNGTIVFADFLGIYGNVVVIDHGLGLQSLYAHLSDITVNTGDAVNKGDIVGHTGTTGLAGGDHLHYGVTVAGIPVQPIEWWDNRWIQHNITSKLN